MQKKHFLAYIVGFLALLLLPVVLMAQVAAATAPVAQPFTLIGFFTGPTFTNFMTVLIGFTAVLLPVIQFLLKRIPTPYSVKITGRLGWFLDVLTWYQKNILHPTVVTELKLETPAADGAPAATVTAKTSTTTVEAPAVGSGNMPA